jgi:hypothetical protein
MFRAGSELVLSGIDRNKSSLKKSGIKYGLKLLLAINGNMVLSSFTFSLTYFFIAKLSFQYPFQIDKHDILTLLF